MLTTENLVANVSDVPTVWIYEHYLTIPKLTGQDHRMHSVFTADDKVPSLYIYLSSESKTYKWKDFSSGKSGDSIALVSELFNLQRFEAMAKILNDYTTFLETNGKYIEPAFTEEAKYKVLSVEPRNWNEHDAKYWGQYHIGSKLLEKYRVQPFKSFTLRKEGRKDDLVIRQIFIYGFFKKDGSLYKIYQPLLKDNKFFKVRDYIQGTDQLEYKAPYLVICSSLKDGLTYDLMNFSNKEWIAPDSENIMIPEITIRSLQEKYKGICTFFDNDEAGLRSMQKYKTEYNLPGVHLKLEKDQADNVKTHGVNNTRIHLYPLLTKALTGVTKHIL